MSETEKLEILERVASLPQEDQRNLAFFVAGLAAKSDGKTDQADRDGCKKEDEA